MKPIAILLLCLLLGACSFGAPRHAQTHYVLSDGQPPVPAAGAPRWSGTLLVAEMEVPSFYQSSALAFSHTSGTRNLYQYARFTDPPGVALTALIMHRLDHSGLFAGVATMGQGVSGPWQLNLQLVDFYHEASQSPGAVHLDFDAQLIDRTSARLLTSKHIQVEATAGRFDAQGAASAANQAVSNGLDQLTQWLREAR